MAEQTQAQPSNWDKLIDSLGDLGTAVVTAYSTSTADRLIQQIQGGAPLAQPGVEAVYQVPKQPVAPVVEPIQPTAGDKLQQFAGLNLQALIVIAAIVYVIVKVAD